MRTTRTKTFLAALALIGAALAGAARADAPFITVASTTSTEESGLFGYLLPLYQAKTGVAVHVVAVGTGQALKIGERGDADVLLVHDTQSELKFIADGFGVGRHRVMYNDFILLGPKDDPAKIASVSDAAAALAMIARAEAPFVSRGDDSGTDKAEKRLWQRAGIVPKGAWYRETGSGMGPALNTAAAMGAYILSDRGTWISFKNRRDLVILVAGDKLLFNQYGVMLVNPALHPQVKVALGQQFIDWLVSPGGQQTIAGYRIASEQLFFPNYDGK
jgi:tungstate transport system substrate-binding protein